MAVDVVELNAEERCDRGGKVLGSQGRAYARRDAGPGEHNAPVAGVPDRPPLDEGGHE